MSSKHIVEVVQGEELTAFHIKPRTTASKLNGLPNPVLFGAEESDPNAVEAFALYKENANASVVAYLSRFFGSQTIEAVDFADRIADHLGELAVDQTPPATA